MLALFNEKSLSLRVRKEKSESANPELGKLGGGDNRLDSIRNSAQMCSVRGFRNDFPMATEVALI